MSSLPKPPPCGQNWLAMSPTENGRRCGQCDKVIHDFSRLSWPEIEQRQQAHGNALCGMYSPAQLTYWGQEPPTNQSICARLTAATTLALTLAAVPAPAQTSTPGSTTAAKTVLRGTVQGSSTTGKPEPASGVTVLLKGTILGTSSDEHGHYELNIPDPAEAPATIVFSMVGYRTTELALPPTGSGVQTHDVQLTLDDKDIEVFSVRMPTRMQRMKWTLKRWFSRDK